MPLTVPIFVKDQEESFSPRATGNFCQRFQHDVGHPGALKVPRVTINGPPASVASIPQRCTRAAWIKTAHPVGPITTTISTRGWKALRTRVRDRVDPSNVSSASSPRGNWREQFPVSTLSTVPWSPRTQTRRRALVGTYLPCRNSTTRVAGRSKLRQDFIGRPRSQREDDISAAS